MNQKISVISLTRFLEVTCHNNLFMSDYHIPVLLSESLTALNIKPGGIYVDMTFGAGGHSASILEKLGSSGRLYGFDQDRDATVNEMKDPRFIFIQANFRHIQRFMRLYGHTEIDGVFMDLGVSSHQLDQAERGFSYRFDAELDMRMNNQAPKDAVRVLNEYPEEKLQEVFSKYGEVQNSRTLAKAIVQYRKQTLIRTTLQFNSILQPLVRGHEVKYFAKVYQAIRMEVNDEIGALEEALRGSVAVLKTGGRLVVIAYHSIEDRVVKNFIKSGNAEGILRKDHFGNVLRPLKAINKKLILPSEEEMKKNSRARSARLRIGEKTLTMNI